MCIRQVSGEMKRRFYSIAEVDSNDLFGSPFCSQLCMPAFAAAALEHDLVFEKVRLDRLQPAEKLFGVLFVFLCKMRPLPAEIGGGFGFVRFDLFELCKPGNTPND